MIRFGDPYHLKVRTVGDIHKKLECLPRIESTCSCERNQFCQNVAVCDS
jgi:hypothetical protein